jgi:hypothetical protein
LGRLPVRRGLCRAAVTSPSPVAPRVSQDIQRGFSILWDSQRKSADGEYYARDYMSAELAPYDPDLALKLTEEPDGTVPDRTLQLTIMRLAEMRPAKAAEWAAARRWDVTCTRPLHRVSGGGGGPGPAGLTSRRATWTGPNHDECWSISSPGSRSSCRLRLGGLGTDAMLQQLTPHAVAAKQGVMIAARWRRWWRMAKEAGWIRRWRTQAGGRILAERCESDQDASYDLGPAYQSCCSSNRRQGTSRIGAYATAARSVSR